MDATFANARPFDVAAELASQLPKDISVVADVVADHVDRLFADEMACVSRAVRKRKSEFATGRILARKLMFTRGIKPVSVPVGAHRQPSWPDGIVGSISHTSVHCAVALGSVETCSALGIDIEMVKRVTPDILSSISHSEELVQYSGSLSDQELAAVLFSVREAIFKAYFPVTGSYLAHKDVLVELDGSAFQAEILASDRPGLCGRRVITGRFGIIAGVVVTSVCVEQN